MERFWPTLRASYAYGAVGLLVGSYAGSVVFALILAVGDGIKLNAVLLAPITGFIIALFALGFGVLPATIICIPAYAVLRYNNRASYWTALLIGLVPGALATAFWAPGVGALFGGYGALVALLTHRAARVTLSGQRFSDRCVRFIEAR